MNPNRMKVLEMLSQGKISLEEAEQLLARLEDSPADRRHDRQEEFEFEMFENDDDDDDDDDDDEKEIDDDGDDEAAGETGGKKQRVKIKIDADSLGSFGERAAEFGERIAARVREKIERKFQQVQRRAEPHAHGQSGSGQSRENHEREVPANPKFLRVLVESHTGDRVNVRVPIALIKTGIALTALVPESAREAIEDTGIDFGALSKLNPDELVQALAALTVDVESHVGDKVQIFCE